MFTKIRIWSLLAAMCAGAALAAEGRSIEVQGHRGTRGLLPEDTLPAFKSALEAGVDVLEMDLAVTRDGVLVISHDPRISPVICLAPDGSRIQKAPLIHELTLAEVKKYDCGTLRNPKFPEQTPVPGTRIPTLKEVFALVKESRHPNAKRVKFNIETKISADHPENTVGPEEFSKKAVEAFRKSGFMKRITLESFDPRTLVEAERLAPELPRVILVDDPRIDMVELAERVHARVISPAYELLDAARVAAFQKNGFKVIPWTVNVPKDWDRMIQMGVDGIITDYPARLIEHLKKAGLRLS